MDQTYQHNFEQNGKRYTYYDIAAYLANRGQDITTYPYTIRILLEEALRRASQEPDAEKALETFIDWDHNHDKDVAHQPERVILQDLTGVPAIVDLAAMRDAVADAGGDVESINPEVPVHLVVDHSVQVDHAGSNEAFDYNVKKNSRATKNGTPF